MFYGPTVWLDLHSVWSDNINIAHTVDTKYCAPYSKLILGMYLDTLLFLYCLFLIKILNLDILFKTIFQNKRASNSFSNNKNRSLFLL